MRTTQAVMNLVAVRAISMSAERLVGEYRPTKKNGMIKDHYASLGPPLETRTEATG